MSDEERRRAERAAMTGDDDARRRVVRDRERVGTKPPPPLDGIVLVLGGRGSGKTTLLQALARRALKTGHHVTVWDRMGHWSEDAYRGATILRRCSAEDAAARAIKLAPTTLVLDEVDLAVPAHKPLDEGSALYEICHMGRQMVAAGEKWGRAGAVALLAAARMPRRVRTDLRSLADLVYLGHMHASEDLDWVAKLTDQVTARSLPGLRPGDFLRRRLS